MRISYCHTLIMTGEALWILSSFLRKACQRSLDLPVCSARSGSST